MQYRDISNDTAPLYCLTANEKVVFFMLNRTGEIVIELAGPGATAHVFALYTDDGAAKRSLSLIQRHLTPDTVSSALVKAVLDGQDSFQYHGAIHITREAHHSDASQESRALLLSPDARVFARPALEILAHDVVCHHAATASPLNDEALFFVQSRGLSQDAAQRLLVRGFFEEALERMEALDVSGIDARNRLASL